MRLTTLLQIGLISAVALMDLALASSLSGRTMSESFVDVAHMAAGLLKVATMGMP